MNTSFAPFARWFRIRTAVLFVMLGWLAVPLASTGELRPFEVKSLAEIRQRHAGSPFVLAFWSISCAPCQEEISALAALKQKYPAMPIILVAADPPSEKAAVVRFLANHKLGEIETWAFADEFAERVRFAVDRKWQGELPQTYFYDAKHQPTTHTGVLDPVWVETWITKETAAAVKTKSPAAPAR